MKFLWFLVAVGGILLFSIGLSHAVVANGVDVAAAPTPQVLGNLVQSLGDGLHILDNATPGTFRDVIHGPWLGGAATALYKQYYVSLDGAYAVPVGQSGFYSPAVRFYAGQLLIDKVPSIAALAKNNLILTSALNYLTVSGWATRDFNNNVYRAGYNLGFQLNFGPAK